MSTSKRHKLQVTCASPLQPESDLQQNSPDISALDQTLQQQWDHAANQHLGNIVVKRFSRRKVWWNCHQCPDGHLHRWLAKVSSRSEGNGCPQCAGRKVCKHNSLATLAPRAASYWDNANNTSTAKDVVAYSNATAQWACSCCGHKWTAKISSRAANNSGCPECSFRMRTPKTRQPTFAACKHPLLAEWDYHQNAVQGIFPDKITLGSNKKVHWLCNKCPAGQQHCWTATPHERAGKVARGCPYCAGKAVCQCNSLQTHYPDVAAEWHQERNPGTPDDFTASSHQIVWWHNAHRGSWQQSINSRTSGVQKQLARWKHIHSQSALQSPATP